MTKPDPALLLDAIAEAPGDRVLPAADRDLPAARRAGHRARGDFSSLKYFMYGAAPMSVEKLKQAIEIFGPVMMGGYGQTEAPASIAFLPPGEHFVDGDVASDERLSSVGRPNPLIRVEIHERREPASRAPGRDGRDLRARRPRDEGLLQGSRTRPPRRSSTAGCTPATSATSTPRATCTSPTARRT